MNDWILKKSHHDDNVVIGIIKKHIIDFAEDKVLLFHFMNKNIRLHIILDNQ